MAPPAISVLSLREQVAAVEKLTGEPSHFKTEAALEAYLTSLERAVPQASFDRLGFLASIGLTNQRAPGRTDGPVLDAVSQQPGYVPDDHHGHTPWIQQKVFDLALGNRKVYLALAKIATPLMEAKSRLQGQWKKPFVSPQKPVPSNVPPEVRYKDAFEKLNELQAKFGDDVHGGLPNINDPTHPTYGTYSIALALGFDKDAAYRFGSMDVGVDDNTTPYGKTSPMPQHLMDRHFNLDRDGQDTRLVYAKAHLETAIRFAKQGAYDQAEIELGCGLHSLQDLYAHGQITPSIHATTGQFPDAVGWNPVAFYEATGATKAYLTAYLKAIKP